MCYKSNDSAAAVAGQHVPHGQGRGRHHTGGHACHNHGQRPIRSLSGQLVTMQDHHHSQHHLHGRNGYLSDGEGYMLQNQRVSRSGKYGSQASSPRSDRHLSLHHDHHGQLRHDDDSDEDDDEDDDEDEDEDEEEEEEEDELEDVDIIDDNIEAEIHMNDLKDHVITAASSADPRTVSGQQPTSSNKPQPPPPGVSGSSDLIVSYSAFQAEAASASSMPGGPRSGMLILIFYLSTVRLPFITAVSIIFTKKRCLVIIQELWNICMVNIANMFLMTPFLRL